MNLQNLIAILGAAQVNPQGLASAEVLGLTSDSREVLEGYVFVAVKGTSSDGHDFIAKAIEQGALAIIHSHGYAGLPVKPSREVCLVAVKEPRLAQEQLARRFYGDPSQRMLCIGVTGTNGKTSTTYLLEHLFNEGGVPLGVIGTIDHHYDTHVWETGLTTPGPILLQKRLSEMKAAGAQGVAMEVSSHALDQFRVDGVQFNVAIFTNLSHDHLDYHQTMESYFLAKQRFFTDLLWQSQKVPLFAVVNRDDPWGRKLRIANRANLWTFGAMSSRKGRGGSWLQRAFASGDTGADFAFEIEAMNFTGTLVKFETPFGACSGEIPLCGLHNVYNVAGAMAAAATLGVVPEQSLRRLNSFRGIPGRLQRVPGKKNVFIDYAHSPDSLEKVLDTLNEVRRRSQSTGEIVVVFGCGGDRDRAKRPVMAQVAERLADRIFVTSDNPRTENPDVILDEVVSGFSTSVGSRVQRQVDRKLAIAAAYASCRPGDVLLIAGKGHENYQQIGTEKIPFSDFAIAQELSQ